jgi:glycerol-3-phosphate acyltransferase PlsX
MRIAVDVMGSDHGPAVIARGAVRTLADFPNLSLVLVGDEQAIQQAIKDEGADPSRCEVVHCSIAIGMHEPPIEAIRSKRDASMMVATKLVQKGEAEAIVSAGSTGAQVASSTLMLRSMPGIAKAGIAALVPSVAGRVVVIDVGANVNAKSQHLFQYGTMGSLFAEGYLGVAEPRIGLLSIGSESTKGTSLVKETHSLFTGSNLNFIGNIEGHEVFLGQTDVVICDGFVGNILLKIAEGMGEVMFGVFAEAAKASGLDANPDFKTAVNVVRRRADWTETGGALLLGLNGVSVIAHGRSNERAMHAAVKTAAQMVDSGLNARIAAAFDGRPVSAAS